MLVRRTHTAAVGRLHGLAADPHGQLALALHQPVVLGEEQVALLGAGRVAEHGFVLRYGTVEDGVGHGSLGVGVVEVWWREKPRPPAPSTSLGMAGGAS